jgi:predicted nucleic acid-binding protein
MKYCADTWFLIELSKSEPKALKIMRNMGKHKNKIVIPSVVILEITRISIRSGKDQILDELIKSLELHKNVEIVDCNLEISKKAGKISANYNIPSVDSIIAATAILYNSDRLISKDSHFMKLNKSKLIKLKYW